MRVKRTLSMTLYLDPVDMLAGKILGGTVGGISFRKHLLEAFTFLSSRQHAASGRYQHSDTLGVEYPDFGFCVTAFIDASDEPVAGDLFSRVNRSFELETQRHVLLGSS